MTRPHDLVVLGSGTALPTERRGPPGYLLRFSDGSGVLLDAGPGSVRQAARFGVPVERLRGVLVTHFHPDHTADLIAVLFAQASPLAQEAGRLHLAGPEGLRELHGRLLGVWGSWLALPSDRLRFHVVRPGPFQLVFEGLHLEGEAVGMHHSQGSLGYRLRGAGGRSLAYSGDTGWGEGPIVLGREADIFLLEAALPAGDGDQGHLTPRLAGRVAERSGCAHLVLTHLYPQTERIDLEPEVRREYGGPLTVATDGLVLEF
ncbi:MAG: MBL fold metallo-hydrolase [Planctomycetota bacterium]